MEEPPELDRREVTRLLDDLRSGSEEAEARLYEVVSTHLRHLARKRLRKGEERPFDTTELVHEAWLRLFPGRADFRDREHFLAVAARAMRNVLIDHARNQNRDKRGGLWNKLPLEAALEVFEEEGIELEALDEALEELARKNERQAKIVELRFFGGLTIEDTASVVGLSHATVEREWRLARLWLLHRLIDD